MQEGGRIRRLNPFRGLPNPLEVWAWGMFDLANQSFTLLINTLLFPVFFTVVVVGDPAKGDRAWGLTAAASLLFVAVVSPLVGAIADERAAKKPMLIATGILCVALTCALGLLGAGMLWQAVALYVVANIVFALGENLLAAFLPELATSETMGRISAIGWTMGYVGALLLLGLSALAMAVFGLSEASQWRGLFVFAGLWFLVMAVPTALVLKERARPNSHARGVALLTIGLRRMGATVRDSRRYGQLLRFLGVFFVYGMGVQTTIFFASIIAADFGFAGARLALFLLPVTVFAGVGAVAAGAAQSRLGYRRTVHLCLGVWVITSGLLLAMTRFHMGEWMLWVVGSGMGLGLGGVGTASRAMVGVLTPAHKTAEFFGLWGLTYRLAGVAGVASFGIVKAASQSGAIAMLLVEFVLGAALLLAVNEKAGLESARRAEREHAGEADIKDVAAAAKMGGEELEDVLSQTKTGEE